MPTENGESGHGEEEKVFYAHFVLFIALKLPENLKIQQIIFEFVFFMGINK